MQLEEAPVSSYYCVVQYAPRPVSGEVLNVGVLAYGDGRLQCQFLQDWRRARSFSGGKDIGFLQRLARDVQAACGEQPTLPLEEAPAALTEEQIRRWTGNWLS